MKTQLHLALRASHFALALALLSTLNSQLSTFGQGTAFTYQGRLFDNGAPANGAYNLRLTLYDASTLGTVVGGPLTNAPVAVSNGLFTVLLDFGSAVFTGSPVWLQIDVSTNTATPAYVSLTTRQQLTPAPYAIYSENAGLANTVNTNSVSAAGLNTLGSPTSGQVLTYSGGSLIWATPSAGSGSGWSLTGNSGAGAFLGTTDNYPLNFVVNDFPAGTFWPFANGSVSVALGSYNYFSTSGNGGNFIAGGGNSGSPNFIYADSSSIGGGYDNRINASSPGSVIAGGNGHRITGAAGAIGGGSYNTVSNYPAAATIPGGANNLVSGDYGFAAGNTAQALHPGAFVWADNSGGSFASTANNQFSVRAAGGVRFATGGAGVTIDGVSVSTGGGGIPWQVVSGFSVQAAANTGYLLTNPQLVTVTLPGSPNLADIVRVTGAGSGSWKIIQANGQSVRGNNLTADVGSTWVPRASSRNWSSVASSADGTKLVAVANPSFIYVSADSGVTWAPTGPSGNFISVASSADGTKLIAADGQAGTLYTSSDSGATWNPHGPTASWFSVASSADGTKLVAVVDGGQIYTSSDSGATWSPQATVQDWVSVASSADGTKLVAAVQTGGIGGQIYTSADSGATWIPVSPVEVWDCVASSADGTKLAATTVGGPIYSSADSGVTWTVLAPPSEEWTSVALSADGTKFVALGYGTQVFTSLDSGVTWTAQGPTQTWQCVASSADGTKLVGGVFGGQIYTSQPAAVSGTTPGTSGYLLGGQASVELQYIGNGQFLIISHEGAILAY